MYGIRRIFKAHCGPGARYVWSERGARDGQGVVVVQFELIPEGRRFSLDGVIHEPGGDAELRAAVVRIAGIAHDVRHHLDSGPVPAGARLQ